MNSLVTALTALPLALMPVSLLAQDATLDEVIAALTATIAVDSAQLVEEVPVERLAFDAVPTGAGCDITFEMVFDAGEPPSSGTITVSTASLDTSDMNVGPGRSADGNGVVTIRILDDAPKTVISLELTPENEMYPGMRSAIEGGQAGGECTETSCISSSTEEFFSVPIAPDADPAQVAGVLDNFGALIELCATAPAAG